MKLNSPAAGTRLRCLSVNGPQALPSGTIGTGAGLTDMRSWVCVAVNWDNGSTLALAVPPDLYELVS
jgi:hypothetical protein